MAVDTLPLAKAQYFDNLDYDTESSVAKCKLFITACRALLLHIPAKMQHGGSGADGFEFNQEELRLQLADARTWLAGNDDSASDQVIFPDFGEFRR